MSESREHQALVARLDRALAVALGRRRRPVIRVDGRHSKGVAPKIIDGYRPDIYAFDGTITVVGEAKPPNDLETRRSLQQILAFAAYIQKEPSRHLVLSVHWSSSVAARSLLRDAAQQINVTQARLHVLDGVNDLVLP